MELNAFRRKHDCALVISGDSLEVRLVPSPAHGRLSAHLSVSLVSAFPASGLKAFRVRSVPQAAFAHLCDLLSRPVVAWWMCLSAGRA